MPFSFLKYLQPIHYFRLFKQTGESALPQVEDLPESVLKHLEQDANYESEIARDYDLSWQAIQKGYIGSDDSYTDFKKLPVKDEYDFIRKQVHPDVVFYVLVSRYFIFLCPIYAIRYELYTYSLINQHSS